MEINKISLGVEAIEEPQIVEKTVVEEIAESKIVKIKEALGLFVLRIVSALRRGANFVLRFFKNLSSMFRNRLRRTRSVSESESGDEAPRQRRFQFGKKLVKPALVLCGVAVLIVAAVYAKSHIKKVSGNSSGSTLGDQVEINAPVKSVDINKEFSFPLTDSKGKVLSSIKYVIQKADLQNEIIVQGQKATSVKGRLFLIIYLKITNEYNQKVQMNTRDYVRLSVNGNEDEWLAPDIHNDPVEIQAQSTKITRLGFPVNESDKDLVLRVGQISGDKQKIDLNF